MKSRSYLIRFTLLVVLMLVSFGAPLPTQAEGVRPPIPEQAAVVVLETISAGTYHSCGVKSDGTIICWGNNQYGQAISPAGTFTQVSTGSSHTCGLKSDGIVVCWGAGTTNTGSWPHFGQSIPPVGTFTQVSAGYTHTCGLKSDGTVICWGSNLYGEATPRTGTFTQVSAGEGYTCGLKSDGIVVCWGSNDWGEATPPTGTFTQVSAGGYHTCGLKTDGTVICWGFSAGAAVHIGPFLQVSAGDAEHSCALKTDGTITCWGAPFFDEVASPAGTFTQVTAGRYHNCGLKSDGTIFCWGAGTTNTGSWPHYGQSIPPTGLFGLPQVSAGGRHTCIHDINGTLDCWGLDSSGQAAEPPGNFIQVSSGTNHTCGLKIDGSLACWGSNNSGQSTPPLGAYVQVSAGQDFNCGLSGNGTTECWGSNLSGQLNHPSGTFNQVSAGSSHACGLRSDGTLACWGAISSGQSTPPTGTFSQVSAGGSHSCGLKSNGSLACWGSNSDGQAAAPTGTFRQVSAGFAHTCGLRSNGSLFCWGSNDHGQAAPPTGTFTQISAGDAHTCAIRSDGFLTCWGDNSNGQANIPPQILEGPSVTVVMSEDGTPIPFSLTLHANGSEGITLTWSISTPASHGTAAASGTGVSNSIGYTPTADYFGSDSFVVQVTDNNNLIDRITVNVTILPNLPPQITESTAVTVLMSKDGNPTPFSLTLHASDPEGGPLSWSISSPASHGTATASGTGASMDIEYTPAVDYLGDDSFAVQVADDHGAIDSIIVSVSILPNTAYISIAETIMGSYDLSAGNVLVGSYPSLQAGPVKVKSLDNSTFFTSERAIYGTSFNEVMGYPASQLTTEYWFPWYDNVSMDTWVLVGNPSSTQTAEVIISFVSTGSSRGMMYSIPPNGRITPRFGAKVDGPVRVVSTNGVKIFASERAVYQGGFNEVMGYPGNQLSTEYWFPWYDDVSMDTWVLVGNPSSTQTAYVSIYIGADKHTYAVYPGGRITPRFSGKVDGPVRVVSTNGVKIFASERSLYENSFNETMGYPANQFTTEYWFPWYDNVSMDTWVLVGNPSSTDVADVEIYVGTTKYSYTLQPGESITPRYEGVNEGPVRVVSINGVKIFASERSLYQGSFNETMGYPANQLTSEYWFPWYDSQTMSTNILVGRP